MGMLRKQNSSVQRNSSRYEVKEAQAVLDEKKEKAQAVLDNERVQQTNNANELMSLAQELDPNMLEDSQYFLTIPTIKPEFKTYHHKVIPALILLLTIPNPALPHDWEESLGEARLNLEQAKIEIQDDGDTEVLRSTAAASLKKITLTDKADQGDFIFQIIAEQLEKGPHTHTMFKCHLSLIKLSQELLEAAINKSSRPNNEKKRRNETSRTKCTVS
jgi:hypothetical protein